MPPLNHFCGIIICASVYISLLQEAPCPLELGASSPLSSSFQLKAKCP